MGNKKRLKPPNFPYNTIDYYIRRSKKKDVDLKNLETNELRIRSKEILLKQKRESLNILLIELIRLIEKSKIIYNENKEIKKQVNSEVPLRIKYIERISKDREKDDGYSRKGFI